MLFTDVVGSTAWRFRVGGSVADIQSADLERASREVVSDHRGVVVKGVGDGVMATFTAATSAFDAAVELQTMARRLGVGDGLRVGISSGDLIREGADWIGDAAIEASRLCNEASGGAILVSDVAVRLVGSRASHDVRHIGRRLLRGFRQDIGVHEIIATPDRVLPAAIAQVANGALVGRDLELTDLRSTLHDVAAGGSDAIIIAGEPGIGKTRLAATVALEADALGFRVLYGRCEEGQRAPYGPILDALQPWLANCPSPLLTRGEPGERIGPLPPPSRSRQPFRGVDDWPFARSTSSSEPRPRGAVSAGHGSDGRATRTARHRRPAVGRGIDWARACSPGAATVPLHRAAGDDAPTRPTDATTTSEAQGWRPGPVGLSGLDGNAVAELVQSRLGALPPDEVAEALRQATRGNPFFLGALLDDLAASGRLRDPGGSWRPPEEWMESGVPAGARGVVRGRVATLESQARRVLEVGAISGTSFDEVTCRLVLGLDLPTCVEAIEQGVSAGLVREVDAGRFEFNHAIVRQTILDDLSLTGRAALHWRVGESLEAISADGRKSEVAMHYAAGIDVGDPRTVAGAARAAGDEAAQATAFAEAAAHYRTLVAVLDRQLPDASERYSALVALGRAEYAGGDIVGAGPVWRRAVETARELGDPVRLFEAARGYGAPRPGNDDEFVELLDTVLEMLGPSDSPLRATVLGWRAVPTVFVQTKRRNGIDHQLVAEAVAMAKRTGDATAIASTLRSRSVAESHGPEAAAMKRDLEEVIDLERTTGVKITEDPSVVRVELAIAELRLGRRREADRLLEEARDGAEGRGFRRAVRAVAVAQGAVAAASGRFADAKSFARYGLGDGDADTTAQFIYGAQILAFRFEQGRLAEVVSTLRDVEKLQLSMRAWSAMLTNALVDAGERSEAAALFNDLISARSRGDQGFADQLALRHLTEACHRLDDAAAARMLLPTMDLWAGQLLVVPYGTSVEGAADRGRGHLLATLRRYDEAVDAFRAAAQLERAVGFPALAARSEFWLADAMVARASPGDLDRAGALFRKVADEADALGMPTLARQARRVHSRKLKAAEWGQPRRTVPGRPANSMRCSMSPDVLVSPVRRDGPNSAEQSARPRTRRGWTKRLARHWLRMKSSCDVPRPGDPRSTRAETGCISTGSG